MEDRNTGRTTRLVDEYIQILFTKGSTGIIRDHYGTSNSDLFLKDLILNRLRNEHRNTNISIYKNKIELLKNDTNTKKG